MRLPPDSIISPLKLAGYLLVRQPHGDKSAFLALGGYTAQNSQRLEKDLREQILTRDALPKETNAYGQLYEITGELIGPNGTALSVRTIWMTERLSGLTRFITLIPVKRPKVP